MVSKKRFSYQWQLFLPLILVLWIVIFGMAWWQWSREHKMRVDMIHDQLSLVGERIAMACSSDLDPQPFIRFTHRYYDKNNRYENIWISVYDEPSGKLLYNIGTPFRFDLNIQSQGLITGDKIDPPFPCDREYFYNTTLSENHKFRVFILLVDYPELTEGPVDMMRSFWIALIAIATIVTVMTYFTTRYITRNIKLLKKFAEEANTNPDFTPTYEFPHDELGEVSRQIMELYRSRQVALQKREKEHQIAIHAMEEKTQIKRQLTNNINHELKTPIGVIKGYLDTVAETPDMQEDTRNHFIEKARQNVERMVSLINDITVLTRLEDGKHNIGTEEVDFHDLVFTHANDIEESRLIGDLEFNFEIPFNCKVVGNVSLLSSMLLNLTKNAVAYSGGSECGINCTGEDNEYYYFEFYDNGRGVPPEHLPHLFERFYRVSEGRDRRTGGTGLGLPIVYNTINFLGGTITVKNNTPHGLKFNFTLKKHNKNNDIKA